MEKKLSMEISYMIVVDVLKQVHMHLEIGKFNKFGNSH